ncbi:MAG: hypothetical protein Q9M91_00045 [Candidatus Dojkabacteria bacterium]|nr:hypothetical protein [Candidatus Dojkabacteria bacterium]MDQ7020222.1 hypothetical protein [Candidatus Dojkabacteria bacterium]
MSIVYVRTNMSRKERFRISTKIIRVTHELFVRKESMAKEPSHINDIEKNYKFIDKRYEFLKQPKLLKKGKDFIDFEFIPSKSLFYKAEESLINKRFNDVLNDLSVVNEIINKFESEKVNTYKSRGFIELFDPESKFSDEVERGCIKDIPFDITSDNLVENQELELYLIDPEWFIRFSIETNYLKFRIIYSLAIRLQKVIKTLVSEDFEVVNIYDDLYIPTKWIEALNLDIKMFPRFIYYEVQFQKAHNYLYINYDNYDFSNLGNKYSSRSKKNRALVNEALDGLININDLEDNPKSSYNDLREELENIKNSRLFRFKEKLNKLRWLKQK